MMKRATRPATPAMANAPISSRDQGRLAWTEAGRGVIVVGVDVGGLVLRVVEPVVETTVDIVVEVVDDDDNDDDDDDDDDVLLRGVLVLAGSHTVFTK
jgi:hypothetical protein